MRVYQIDELTREDVEKVEARLVQKGWTGSIKGMYYVPIPEEFLGPEQREHLESCGPFFLPLETGDGWIRLELLVRARQILRCSCVAYANAAMREHMIDSLDVLVRELDIAV
ncbi:hypothetical protein [Fundidesulfovibrio agrisoli]|uniref:hypothetical protein n=1 Tax=Fundidesulfovibrio agrisoli TaxID=2922717 RepID=UPI001FAE5FFC|nr:hypothetical protein [Fundidesulfovibrio agrisoli]